MSGSAGSFGEVFVCSGLFSLLKEREREGGSVKGGCGWPDGDHTRPAVSRQVGFSG